MKGGNLEKNSREFLKELKLVHLSIVQTIQEQETGNNKEKVTEINIRKQEITQEIEKGNRKREYSKETVNIIRNENRKH